FINNVIEKPEGFIIPKNEEYSIEALKVTKELFDLGVKEEKNFFSNNKPTSNDDDDIRNPFEELIVDGIDNDLIWAEIELKNNLFSKFLNKQLIDIEKKVMNQNYSEEVENNYWD
ncbi:4500_t:CDS:2, partial [Entrophospora sp. SA101]